MKIAAYNVENLFDRPKAFNEQHDDESDGVIPAVAKLNTLFEEDVYTDEIKTQILELIKQLRLEKRNESSFVRLRQIRGQIISRPKNSPAFVKANGRDDWVGWIELKTETVNEIAIMNTGRVIKEVNADILVVIEAENRPVLKQFNDMVLPKLGGTSYEQVMVIDGNDTRGIDVGLMTQNGYIIDLMRSHIHDLQDNGHPIFSRDCPEYAVHTPQGELIWILPNHFKSKFGGNNKASRDKRLAQATRTAEIYNELRTNGHDKIVILGDFNDTPNSNELKPLLVNTDLKDISEHQTFDTGEFDGIGTFGLGNDSNKIDYLLLSPSLFDRVVGGGLFRKGAWPGVRPKRWEVFPELKEKIHVASDHHLIWAEIEE